MQSLRYLRLIAVLAGTTCLVATSANAQNIRQLGQERVSIKAEAVALGALLDQLAAIAPMENIRIDPADRLVPVSLDAEDLGPLEAMGLVLKASGLDFVMSNKRIVVGRAAKAAESAAGNEKSEHTLAERTVDPPDRRLADSVDEDAVRKRTDDQRVIATPAGFGGIIDRPALALQASPSAPPAAQAPTAAMESENSLLDSLAPPPDQFGLQVGAREVPFAVHEDSVTVQQSSFVPYKLRPEVVKRRLATQVAIIP